MSKPSKPTRTAAFVVALTIWAAAAAIILIAADVRTRVDVTRTGQHQLSPRANGLITQLEGRYEIITAIDETNRDRRSTDAALDVLDAFANASPDVDLTRIDVSTAQGSRQYRDLLNRLTARDAEITDRGTQTVRTATATLGSLSEGTAAFARRIADLPNNAGDQIASISRVLTRRLEEVADGRTPNATIPDPTLDAAALREPLTQYADQMEAINRALDPVDRSLAAEAARLRDTAAVAADTLLRVERPDSARIATALATGEAIVILGPKRAPDDPTDRPTLTAIDPNDAIPDAQILIQAGISNPAAEAARRTEDLTLAAFAALARDDAPIVVFTHAERARFVTTSPLMPNLIDRLARQGIDTEEWAVAVDETPPDLSRYSDGRPVIYAVIAPDSAAAGTDQIEGPAGQNGAERTRLLGQRVQELADRGEPILLNLAPSLFPTFGETDPLAQIAQSYSIGVDAAMPILTERTTEAGRVTAPEHVARPNESGRPLADAIRGLPLSIDWPVPLSISSEDAFPLATLEAAPTRWAEREWARLWATRPQDRALLTEQPTFSESDGDTRGPWLIAAAADPSPSFDGPIARIVVVGARRWMFDAAWQAQNSVDGRAALTFPGNIELFEGAVTWLAERDELIGTGPTSRVAPLIKPLNTSDLDALRWLLIAGVPLGVLMIGACSRLIWR